MMWFSISGTLMQHFSTSMNSFQSLDETYLSLSQYMPISVPSDQYTLYVDIHLKHEL